MHLSSAKCSSHLPSLDLRFGRLTGTAGAAGLLLQQLNICLLACCREREGAVVKYDRIYKKGKEQKEVDSADEGVRRERMSTKGKSAEKK